MVFPREAPAPQEAHWPPGMESASEEHWLHRWGAGGARCFLHWAGKEGATWKAGGSRLFRLLEAAVQGGVGAGRGQLPSRAGGGGPHVPMVAENMTMPSTFMPSLVPGSDL